MKDIIVEDVFDENDFLEKYSKFWLTELTNFQIGDFDSYLTFLKQYNYLNKNLLNKNKITYTKITLPRKNGLKYNISNSQDIFITSCMVLLYKVNNYSPTSVWFTYDEMNKIPVNTEYMLSKYLPFNADFKPDMSLHEALSYTQEKIILLQKKKTFLLENWYNSVELLDKSLNIYIGINKDFSVSNFDKKFTIGFHISNNEESLYVCLNSNKSHAKYLPFLNYLKKIVLLLVENKSATINSFSLASDAKIKAIINKCTGKKVLHNISKNIVTLFKESVKKFPNKAALKLGNTEINYKTLDKLSNQFANYLQKKGFCEGDFACILLDRTIELIIAIIGVLKAGGTYVPMDVKFPAKRIQYIVDNSKSKFIISKECFSDAILASFSRNSLSIINIDIEQDQIVRETSSFKLNTINNNAFAYLIYTSGSTGNPKGVFVSHSNVVNYATWFNKTFKLNERTCIDFSSSISFDISIACTLVPLMFGACIAICPEETKLAPYDYLEHLKFNKITHIECTPDYFNQMLSLPKEIRKLPLKWVLLGADAVIKKDIERWLKLKPTSIVVNEYGPTECTVAVTAHIVTLKNINKYDHVIPIGKPAFNTQAYVMDEFLNICPIGITGELYIAGNSVSAGYNDENLTKSSFKTNPFKNNSFMYKTGDFVRLHQDGNLEYLGRRDNQIKIRGYRIELREVEDALLKNPLIMQCKVLPKADFKNEKSLIAFLVPYDKKKQLSSLELRNFLRNFIPEYMLPSEYIWIDSFPTNSSGKVDIKQLYRSNIECNISKSISSPTLAEADDLTRKIYKIWCEVFNTNEINLDDDFFDLGGNSLIAIKLLTKLNVAFNLQLKAQTILNSPTINKLSSAIQNLEKNIQVSNTTSSKAKEPELICLQPHGNKDFNLFLIHPVGGTIYMFKKLAKLLGKKNPIYALQDPGIENPSIRFKNMQEMACYYLQAIQKVQQKGSYYLAGASFGATLAIEIANQLTLLGEKVNFIGLLDGWALHSKKLSNENFFQNLMKNKVSTFDKEYAKALLKMQFSREKMLFHYKIPTLVESVYLFKAIELWDVFKEIDSPYNGWENYSDKEIITYSIPGDHESIFNEPNVRILAKYLRMCLDKTFNKGN